jgi:hypothetical protein
VISLSPPEERIVCQVLAHRESKAVEALLEALRHIDSIGPEKEPRPQKGSDSDPLLAWEDGHNDGLWEAAKTARDALQAWEER